MRNIIVDTLWMARRYANGTAPTVRFTLTSADGDENKCVQLAIELGIEIHDDQTLIEDGNSNAKFLDIN